MKTILSLLSLKKSIVLTMLFFNFFCYATIYIDINGYTSDHNVVQKVTTTPVLWGSPYNVQYTLTIPFFDTSAHGLMIKSNYPNTTSMSVFIMGTEYITTHNYFIIFSNNAIQNLTGNTLITVKSKNLSGQIVNTQTMKVTIVNEVSPTVNRTLSTSCQQNNGNNTGKVDLFLSGSHQDGSSRLTAVVIDSNNNEITSTNSFNYMPNGTLSFGIAISTNTTYTIKLKYKMDSSSGSSYSAYIASGSYGWNDISFTKTRYTCPITPPTVPSLPIYSKNSNNSNLSINFTNPVKDFMVLNIEDKEIKTNYEITFYDFSGSIVKKEILNKKQNNINVQNLKKGIYLVEINNGKEILREKIIKE